MTELPEWAKWRTCDQAAAYTVGIEEELMLLDDRTFELSFRAEEAIARMPAAIRNRASLETHAAVLEVETGVHATVAAAVAELAARRVAIRGPLAELGLVAAAAGTHPLADWEQTVVPDRRRARRVLSSMRELARREPSMALHVHVAVVDAERAVNALNGLRTRLPLLLALSANSPYWQGRDTGLASARTPLFHAFPRTGIPAPFRNYRDWVDRVSALVEAGAIPDPSFLWWDVRLQPRLGTVEIRIMDAQVEVAEVTALTALVQSLVHLEAGAPGRLGDDRPEVLLENRFLAARDGVEAAFVEVAPPRMVPLREQLEAVLAACEPHAEALGCGGELAAVRALSRTNGAARQREVGEREGIDAVAPWLASRLVVPTAIRA